MAESLLEFFAEPLAESLVESPVEYSFPMRDKMAQALPIQALTIGVWRFVKTGVSAFGILSSTRTHFNEFPGMKTRWIKATGNPGTVSVANA